MRVGRPTREIDDEDEEEVVEEEEVRGSVGEERRAESETAHRSSVVGSDPLLKGASQHL